MFDFESSGISFDLHFVQILGPETQFISIEKLLLASDFGRVLAGNAENHIQQDIHEASIIIDTVEGGASRLRAHGREPPVEENDVPMLAPGIYNILHVWKAGGPIWMEHPVDASPKVLELSGTPYNNRKCSAIRAFGMIRMMNHSISMQLFSFMGLKLTR